MLLNKGGVVKKFIIRIKLLFLFCKNKILGMFYKTPKVMSDVETVDYILKNKVSIGRYGDSEIISLQHKDAKFQIKSKELSEKLKAIRTDEKFLICIPDIFNSKTFNSNCIIPPEYEFWIREKRFYSFLYKKYFNNNKLIGDAFISRFYLRKTDKSSVGDYLKKLKLLWNKKNIIFVEGKNSRLGFGNDLFDNAISIKRILCPQKDAFEKYDMIISSIRKYAKPGDLVILALGATATVLAYELRNEFQCLDLGHIDIEYEWFLMKATTKMQVKNKCTQEVKDSFCVTPANDKEYLSQIVDNLAD